MGCQRPPDVWHEVDFLGFLDVSKHFLDNRVRVVFVHQFHGRHVAFPLPDRIGDGSCELVQNGVFRTVGTVFCSGSVPRFSAHELLGLAVLGGHSVLSFYSPAPTLTPGATPRLRNPPTWRGKRRGHRNPAMAQASSMSAFTT